MKTTLMPLAALTALSLACSTSTNEQACTLIGCSDGLIVRVAGLTEGTASIELKSAGRPPIVLTCDGPAHCAAGVQFEHQTPAHATITVTSGDRVQAMEAEPAYVKSRPNGPGCEPECKQATVTVTLPAT